MSNSFSASNKLTQVLNGASTTLAVRIGTDLPQLQPSKYILLQFAYSDASKFFTHNYIGAAGGGNYNTAHGYISVDDQIMWFDGITIIGANARFKVYKRRINISSVISHAYNAPIQMRVTRQHLLQIQGFITSISRAFSTSGNSIINLDNSSYGFEYTGSKYNVGNTMWNSMTAVAQSLRTQFNDVGGRLSPKNNAGLTAAYLLISGNTTVGSLSRASLSIGGLQKDLKWDQGYNTLQGNSASWITTLPATSNWNNSYNTLGSYSAGWERAYSSVFSNSAGWMSTSATVFSNSASWASGSISLPSSATWNRVSSVVTASSANWNNSYNALTSYSAGWMSTSATVFSNSASWDNVGYVKANGTVPMTDSWDMYTNSYTTMGTYTNDQFGSQFLTLPNADKLFKDVPSISSRLSYRGPGSIYYGGIYPIVSDAGIFWRDGFTGNISQSVVITILSDGLTYGSQGIQYNNDSGFRIKGRDYTDYLKYFDGKLTLTGDRSTSANQQLLVGGFSKFGADVVAGGVTHAVKFMSYRITTSATSGTTMNFRHGLNRANIITIWATVFDGTSYFPNETLANTSKQIRCYYNATDIYVRNVNNLINSKPRTVTVMYHG